MTIVVRDDVAWRADGWIERLVLERIACRLLASVELAEDAGRAMASLRDLDLRAVAAPVRAAIAAVLAAGNDDRGIAPTVRAASGATVAWAIDGLVRGLRGEPVPVVACPSTFVHVRLGAANAPDSPWGADILQLRDDGVVYYENRHGGRLRSSVTAASPAVVQGFLAAARGGMPPVPPFQRLPGAGYVDIAVAGPGGAMAANMPIHLAAATPGYRELIAAVDAWSGFLREPARRGASPGLAAVVDGPSEPAELPLCRPRSVPTARPIPIPMPMAMPSPPTLPVPPPVAAAAPPAIVSISAADAAARGLPPIALRLSTAGMIATPFPDAGTYVIASGPPGGPLLLRVQATAEPAGDLDAVRRVVAPLFPGNRAPRAWSEPVALALGGEHALALAFLSGAGLFQAVWLAAIVSLPAGSLLISACRGVGPAAASASVHEIVGHPALGAALASLSFSPA
jgi:hypothetical protein